MAYIILVGIICTTARSIPRNKKYFLLDGCFNLICFESRWSRNDFAN